jgi:hypothetical protein
MVSEACRVRPLISQTVLVDYEVWVKHIGAKAVRKNGAKANDLKKHRSR